MTAQTGRVSRSRLTPLGAIVLVLTLASVAAAPPTTDRQILAIVWAGAIAVLVVGIAWPMVAVRRITVEASSPADARVGDEVPITATARGRGVPFELRLLDPPSDWHRPNGTDPGVIGHLADRRGVFHAIAIEVRTTAPLGVFEARRGHVVTLPSPVSIAPAPWSVEWRPTPAPIEALEGRSSAPVLGGDLVRSVRPYVAGDPAHLVHWPSTARTGSVVVRELEPPTPTGQAIVVDLRDLGDETEAAASYAFGAALAVLASGGELLVCTAEAHGPVVGAVRTPLQAGRRLARAVAGVPAAAPEGWPVVEIGR